MTTYDFVQLVFLASKGEIKGKTKLQKTVYFLGLLTGHEKDFGYRPHFYGPYSDEVAAAVERLKALGFLSQTVSTGGSRDSRGFEVARHDYSLNESGQKMAQVKSLQLGSEWKKIQQAMIPFSKLSNQDYMKLSIAAKTWFMLGENKGHATMKDLEALAPKFGWSVTVDQVTEAAQLLQEVGLVKLN